MRTERSSFWPGALAVLSLAAAALLAGTAARATSSVWTPLGPFGGSVQTLTVDPGDARVLYATLGAQGAFKSADGGATWVPLHAGVAEGNVAVDPSRHGTLYLAPGGVQKSTDGGAHWTDLSLKAYGIVAVAVDPARPSRLYAASSVNGVFRSADRGASWQLARQPLPAGDASHVKALAVARTGGIVYAGTGAGVYKSVDGALSWRPASQGLPPGAILALAVAPSDPKTVYAGVNNNSDKAVYRSTDGGGAWRRTAGPPLPRPGPEGGSVLALAVSPASPRTVWAGTDPSGLFLTTDGGAHWTTTGPQPPRPVLSVAVAPSSSRTIYTGVLAQGFDLGGVFASADGGATWARRNQGLSAIGTSAFAVDPVDPDRLWTASFRSGNRGKRWVPFHAPDPILQLAVGASSEVFAVLFYQTHGFLQQSLWKTADDGASWSPVDLGVDVALVRTAPSSPSTLYALNASSLSGWSFYRSMDYGQAWEVRSRQTLLDCGIGDLAVAPSASEVVYLAGCKLSSPARSAVLRSGDGGATWTAAATGLPGQLAAKLAVDPHDPDIVYVAVGLDNSPGGPGDGVWKSTDGGQTWARTGAELAGRTVTALLASPAAGVVWAAVEGGRIFRSGDGGATWEDRTGGLQAFQVYQLEIDPADPRRVYAATSGGIWTLEDVP
jgi:photosystem II stability/assembly factor-like uncharacterized protein